MRKFIILFVFALIISACDKSSSSDSDTSFRIQPDTLTAFSSPATTYDIDYNSVNYIQGATGKAIIYNGTINNNSYVGIACSNNPQLPENPNKVEGFNLKIYFPSSVIPSGSYLIDGDEDATIYIYNGTAHSGITGGSITLNFDSPVTSGSYTTYRIHTSAPGNLVVGGATLTDIDITALKTP